MTVQAVDWPLSAMRAEFNSWERGNQAEVALKNHDVPADVDGVAVPELDGVRWLNTDKRSLAEFRGRYVLLDFYTTWCGPCAYDYPTIALCEHLYRDRGVAVIGVHDNSSSVEEIRKHAARRGMDIPIVVDRDDGRIVKSYENAGLVRGYPSYILLNPGGRLLTADHLTPGPLLRFYKIELIRQALLQSSPNQSQ